MTLKIPFFNNWVNLFQGFSTKTFFFTVKVSRHKCSAPSSFAWLIYSSLCFFFFKTFILSCKSFWPEKILLHFLRIIIVRQTFLPIFVYRVSHVFETHILSIVTHTQHKIRSELFRLIFFFFRRTTEFVFYNLLFIIDIFSYFVLLPFPEKKILSLEKKIIFFHSHW